MTPDQRAELRAAAEKATRGPWLAETDWDSSTDAHVVYVLGPNRALLATTQTADVASQGDAMADAAFIAAASPDVVLALLNDLRFADELMVQRDALVDRASAAEAEVAGLRAELAREQQAHNHTVHQRDRSEQAADALAYTIADQSVIGEHSSANDPWANAVEIAAGLRAELDTARAENSNLYEAHDVLREFADGLTERGNVALAERDEALAQLAEARRTLDELVRVAQIEHRGPSHSNAWHLRQGASRLDRGFPVGGGNHTRATARIARAVADLCETAVASRPSSPNTETGSEETRHG